MALSVLTPGIASVQPVTIVGDSTSVATYTDKSGTITTGGTAQVLSAANTSRNGFWIRNLSGEVLWIQFGSTAVAGTPSLPIYPNEYWEAPAVPTTALSVYGATTGSAWSAREW